MDVEKITLDAVFSGKSNHGLGQFLVLHSIGPAIVDNLLGSRTFDLPQYFVPAFMLAPQALGRAQQAGRRLTAAVYYVVGQV